MNDLKLKILQRLSIWRVMAMIFLALGLLEMATGQPGQGSFLLSGVALELFHDFDQHAEEL